MSSRKTRWLTLPQDGELQHLSLPRVEKHQIGGFIFLVMFLGVFVLMFGYLSLIRKWTKSSIGRMGTPRWFARASMILSAVMLFGAIVTAMMPLPWLATILAWLFVVLAGAVAPFFLWLFLLGMSRAGSPLRRRLAWGGLGFALSGMLLTGCTVALFAFAAFSVATPQWGMLLMMVLGGSGFAVPVLSFLMVILSLSDFWPTNAGTPQEHIDAVAQQLKQDGLHVSRLPHELYATAGDTKVHFDLSQSPTQVTIQCPLPDLPAGLMVRARKEGESSNVLTQNPIVDSLLYISADHPAEAVALLDGLHEALLANLHAWPDSFIANGMLHIQMQGPPFHKPNKKTQNQPPSAESSAQAISEQVRAAQDLVHQLQHAGQASAAHATRRPIPMMTPQS